MGLTVGRRQGLGLATRCLPHRYLTRRRGLSYGEKHMDKTRPDLSDEQLDVVDKLTSHLGATAYATQCMVQEIRRHRAALVRLSAWADELDICPVVSRGVSMADELRSRIKGDTK